MSIQKSKIYLSSITNTLKNLFTYLKTVYSVKILPQKVFINKKIDLISLSLAGNRGALLLAQH